MSKTIRYKLKPSGPFHIGGSGIGIEKTWDIIHSDTLFSAIVSAWRSLGEKIDSNGNMELLTPFFSEPGNPPFKLSSAFPYSKDVLLFPAPMIKTSSDKKERKAQFVSSKVLRSTKIEGSVPKQSGKVYVSKEERLLFNISQDLQGIQDNLNKKIVSEMLRQEFKNNEITLTQNSVTSVETADNTWCIKDKQQAYIIIKKEEKLNVYEDHIPSVIWKSGYDAIVPRVTIDRISSASAIYHCGELVFSDDCGLYFWVELIDESYEQHLSKAMEFLSEEGIGGERSIGCGRFSYTDPESVSLPTANDANLYMTMSLYHPTCNEVKNGILDESAYELVTRRGWLRSPDGGAQRRKSVKMLAEGSVFSQPSFVGDIPDVRPKGWDHHPIYDYGLAFILPIRWEVSQVG